MYNTMRNAGMTIKIKGRDVERLSRSGHVELSGMGPHVSDKDSRRQRRNRKQEEYDAKNYRFNQDED